MKFWKKQIFSLLAALAVLLTLVPQRAEAASCGLSGAGSVRAGNTVTVTFSISGGDILGFEADLSYDNSQLPPRQQLDGQDERQPHRRL